MNLLERDTEIAIFDDILDSCFGSSPVGRVAVISGPPGIGKSALLHTLTRRAVVTGGIVVGAAAVAGQGPVPALGMMHQLLHAVAADSQHRRDVLAALDSYTAAATAADPSEAAYTRLLHSIDALLRDLSARSPIMMFIDDAPEADPASLRCLAYVMRRVMFVRSLVVMTARLGGPVGDPAAIRNVLLQPNVTWLRLRPLSRAGVALLATDQIGPAAEPLATALHTATGGSPLLVQALVDDQPSACGAIARLGDVPASGAAFEAAVLTCMHRLDPAIADVARAVAVLDGPVSPIASARLLDVTVDQADGAAQVLAQTGLVEAGRFRHPAAARIVHRDLPPQRRAGLHRRAAQLHYVEGARAIHVAGHLVAAGHPAEAWAIPVLRAAAVEAQSDQPGRAVTFLKLAAGACPDGWERAAVLARAATIDWSINPSAIFHYLPDLIAAVGEGRLDAAHGLGVVSALAWHGQTAQASAVLSRLGRSSTRQGDRAVAAYRTGRLLLLCVYPGLTSDGGSDSLPGALAAMGSTAMGPPGAHATRALATLLTGGEGCLTVEEASQLLRTTGPGDGDPTGGPETIAAVLVGLLYTERLEAAGGWADLLDRQALGRRSPTWRAVIASLKAEIALRGGELPAADRLARSALADIPGPGWGVVLGAPMACRLLAAAEMGRLGEAAEQASAPVPDALFQSLFGLYYLRARGRFHLAAGRPHDALADFHRCGDQMARWGVDTSALIPWRVDVGEAHLRLGHVDRCRAVAEEQLARESDGQSRPAGNALRLLAATNGPAERVALLLRAVDILRSTGARVDLARALSALGGAYRDGGEPAQARMAIRAARLLANQCGAQVIAGPATTPRGGMRPETDAARAADDGQQVRRPPRHRAATPHVLTQLTEAERRVATLAALGHTNGEIAEALYITISTVEQHLTKVYRKLNVRSRADLPVVPARG
ncbi:LuxR family transcriptional regulator [Frankia sp. AgB32]|uniref:helix-turn-helix transcriptional regulator n=1 Tax=Frankia sp. AgB32 TaxID=631119 RepID=UPI00200CBAFC|nr:LuxR family transcriptional regulator [Frankia sp. AgB32]MCK9896151.1 AAA family ATPase [Frankia sp. AgB32]